ncbi:MAG: hypothetical protein IE922_04745 [Sphingomonadales bacterium]|nr:hypothetical protein [Sphingomonadales bacterium]
MSVGAKGGAAVLALASLAACAAPGALPDGGARAPRLAEVAGYQGAFLPTGELAVRRVAQPFGYADGAEAKRAARALCGGDVASGPQDNFRDGAWHFPGGCA